MKSFSLDSDERPGVRAATLVLLGVVITGSATAEEFWCEGLDDDLDGQIDEICAGTCENPYRLGLETAVAPSSLGTTSVSMARTGFGLGVAYADTRGGPSQVFARVLAPSGAPDGDEAGIGNGLDPAYDPAIVWNGDGFGIAWVDEREGNPEVYFRRLNASGAPASAAVAISSSSGASLHPSVAWTGSEYGIVWDDVKGTNRDIYFQRVSASGTTIGQGVRLMSDSSIQEQPSLAWDGAQYVLAWTDERDGNREIYIRRMDGTGGLLGSEVRATTASGASERPRVAVHAAGDLGIVWQDSRSGQPDVYYGRFSAPAYASPINVPIASAAAIERAPVLTSSGTEAWIVWEDHRSGSGEVWARRVSFDGAALSTEVNATSEIVAAGPEALWHGSGVVIGLLGTPDSNPTSFYFAQLRCGGTDADLDAFLIPDGDCNDLSSAQSPAVTESCSGVDDDCDGAIDEGCRGTCRAEELTVPFEVAPGTAGQQGASLVRAPTGYAVAFEQAEWSPQWGSQVAVWFLRLDPDGQPLGPANRVSPPGRYGSRPRLVWNGTEYGMVWEQQTPDDPNVTNVAFARIDAAGEGVLSTREVTRDPPILTRGFREPWLAWSGSQYGLVFVEMSANPPVTGHVIRFVQVDRDGRACGRPRAVTESPYAEWPHLIVDGDGFALAYTLGQNPRFRRLDGSGGLRGPSTVIRDTVISDLYPVTARSPSGFGYVWVDSVIADVYYQQLDAAGGLLGSPVAFSRPEVGEPIERVSMHWIGSEFMLAMDNGSRVHLFSLDEAGNRVRPPVRIDQDAMNFEKNRPSLAWDGVHSAVAWTDSRTTGGITGRIVFSSQTCCEDVPQPGHVTGLAWENVETLMWNPSGWQRFDRVRGSLDTVRSRGDFLYSSVDCTNDLAEPLSTESAVPAASVDYYLVRGQAACWLGSYDDGTEAGSRDPDLDGSEYACP